MSAMILKMLVGFVLGGSAAFLTRRYTKRHAEHVEEIIRESSGKTADYTPPPVSVVR